MKKIFIGTILLLIFSGVFLAGCTKEKTYTCSKDSDCALGIRTDQCCAMPQAFHRDRINADPNIVLYEEGKDYSSLLPANCKNVQCMPLPPFKSIKAICQNNSCKTKWEQISKITDWRVYKSSKYGFELNYPPDWKIGESDFSQEQAITTVYSTYKGRKYPDASYRLDIDSPFKSDVTGGALAISVEVFNNPERLPAQDWLDYLMLYRLNPSYEKISLGNIQGTRVKFRQLLSKCLGAKPEKMEAVLVIHKNLVYVIWNRYPIEGHSLSDESTKYFNQIISSFKVEITAPKPTATAQPTPEPTTGPPVKIETAPTDKISVEPVKKALFSAQYQKEDSSFEPKIEQYSLPLDLTKVQNYNDVKEKLGFKDATLLQQNGFMVFDWRKPNDVVNYYEILKEEEIPVFITSDSLLHLYHVQFNETLKEIEEKEFFNDITLLSKAMLADSMKKYNSLEGNLKEAAKRNAAFFSVALKLLNSNAEIPPVVQGEVGKEIKLIEEHKGMEKSPIFVYKEDYSQYVPRGHYTRSEKLKRYFKAMMWYGRMSFLLKGNPALKPGQDSQFDERGIISVYDAKIQTIQALFIAGSIENVLVGKRRVSDIWKRIYDITSFYVGFADDLTPYEYIDTVNEVFGGKMNLQELKDENSLLKIKAALAQLRNPKIFGGTGNAGYFIPLQDLKSGIIDKVKLEKLLARTKGMRLMGQRFVPDSYIFQRLVSMGYTGSKTSESGKPFTKAWSNIRWIRGYPKGLDIMAVFGSERALEILKKEGDADYEEKGETYLKRVEKLGKEFGDLNENEWHQNLYWSWLYSLKALLKGYSKDYPTFMQGNAWKDKQLNTVLGSWAQLRHDTILYAKQSYTPLEVTSIGPGPMPKKVVGYVEPVPEFYARLLALNEMTLKGLKERNALSKQAEGRMKYLSEILKKLLELSKQELENKELSDEDYDFIKYFGSSLESTVTGIEVDKGLETTIVADVHTCTAEENVLEEGTGYLRTMIVAYKVPDGRILLGAGPVFSYHEFKWPMKDRLTDEKWREMLEKGEEPEKAPWINSFYTG